MINESNYNNIKDIPIASSFFTQYKALTIKEFKIQLRYPISFISSFIMIFLIIAVFSMVAKLFINPNAPATGSTFNNKGLATYMFWGFMAFNFFGQTLYSLGKSLRLEQQTGTLETLFLLPMNQLANLLAKISWGVFINVFVGIFGFFVVDFLTGTILLGFPDVLLTLLAFLCFFLQINGLSFLIAGLSVRIKDSIEPIIGFGQFVLMIFCSFFFPFSVLGSLIGISLVFPMSYSMDILRSTVFQSTPELATFIMSYGFGSQVIVLEWVYMILSALLLPVIGYRFYLYAIYSGMKDGNLSDY